MRLINQIQRDSETVNSFTSGFSTYYTAYCTLTNKQRCLLRKYAPLFPGKSAKAVWGKNMNRGKRSRENMEEKSRKKKD
jgi:hypothetical protein